ncbi:MAG: hypothetical protein LBT31_08425 [Synergistaceae bacterium]|jgi:hypothetical protein|nr:hypothetical protein [Synergistaceae bacterium]
MAEAAAKKPSGLASKGTATRSRTPKQGRAGQLLIMVLLMGCCFGSFYFFRDTMNLVDRSRNIDPPPPTPPNQEVLDEGKDVMQLAGDLLGVGKATNFAMQTALMAEIHGGYPIASPSILTPPPPPDRIIEFVPEPEPPRVTVLAIVVTDGDSVAMIDVEGEEGGLLVRRGSKFASGDARITKIDSKGVTFTWMKKSYIVGVER